MNGLLMIVIAILAAFSLGGMMTGFVKTIFRLAINILAWVIGIMITPHISSFLFKDILSGNGQLVNHITIFVIIFVLLNIAFLIISKSLDIITKLPILKTMNRFLGFLTGFIEGILVLWIMFAIFWAIKETSFGESMQLMINQNSFLSFLYQNNLVLHIIEDMFK